MGLPGLAVALLFASASTSFVMALQFTTVANILLVQAGAPLIAALLAWAALGERVAGPTWAAIAAVLVGIVIMMSDALSGTRSLAGDALALWLTLAFSATIVIVRRFSQVRMVPAVCLGTLIAAGFAATQAPSLAVRPEQMAVLFGFGALSLGLGLALFMTGARLVPRPWRRFSAWPRPCSGRSGSSSSSARFRRRGRLSAAALSSRRWSRTWAGSGRR